MDGSEDPFAAHGEKAREQALQAIPGLVGCVQSLPLSEQIGDRDVPPYAGALEVWFAESAQALQFAENASVGSPLLADSAQISAVVCGMERIVMRAPEHHDRQYIKAVFPFCRKQGMSVQEFQAHWWHNHGPIAALTEEALCYVQTHVLPVCYDHGAVSFDGVTELHWSDAAAAQRAMASRQMVEDQGSDAPKFVDTDSIELILMREEVLIAP